jgi:hypothetical protein
MKTAALAAAIALIAAPLPATPIRAQEGPKLSDNGWCVAFYNAMNRARDRRTRTPRALHETAGFLSIDFARRAAAVRAKLTEKEDFAITYHQQAFEIAFDGAGYAEADGKAPTPEQSRVVSFAVIEARKCDTTHGFAPKLLDRIAAMPAPPVDPYSCAVNYWALGMGMKSNPEAQRAAMSRIGVTMQRFDPQIASDTVWRDLVRARIQADAAERNKAVGEGKVKPQDLFAHSQACDAMLAKPAG